MGLHFNNDNSNNDNSNINNSNINNNMNINNFNDIFDDDEFEWNTAPTEFVVPPDNELHLLDKDDLINKVLELFESQDRFIEGCIMYNNTLVRYELLNGIVSMYDNSLMDFKTIRLSDMNKEDIVYMIYGWDGYDNV